MTTLTIPASTLARIATVCLPYTGKLGDERLSVDQAEVVARHLLAAVAMAREVTR